jgi:centrosomal protein CEP76
MTMISPKLSVEILSAKSLNVSTNAVHNFQLHALFRNQVVRSETIQTIGSADPVFNFSCEFSLDDIDTTLTLASLLDVECPVLIYITSTTDVTDERNCVGMGCVRSLIAASVIDFRYSLMHSQDYISIELLPCELDGVHLGVSAGLLFARLQLTGLPLTVDMDSKSQHDIEDIIWNYQTKLADENRSLYHTARSWWAAAARAHPHVSGRVFKIIAEDELGYHRSVCSLVTPIAPHRSVLNPRFSARFVSLIPFRRDAGLTGGRVETWRSAHAMLSRLQGDVEDHALLLCSLLLGWGLDAWVVLGTIATPNGGVGNTSGEQRPYCWVATLDGRDENNEPKVTFWEAISGKQYELSTYTEALEDKNGATTASPPQTHMFSEVHCMFRHDMFALNIQQICTVVGSSVASAYLQRARKYTSFDLLNEKNFMVFPKHALSPALQHPGAGLAPLSRPIDLVALEEQLEEALREHISSLRLKRDLYTVFDEGLSTTLQVLTSLTRHMTHISA